MWEDGVVAPEGVDRTGEEGATALGLVGTSSTKLGSGGVAYRVPPPPS